MSNFILDSRLRQVEDGSLFFNVLTVDLGPTTSNSARISIEVGANDCEFVLDVTAPLTTSIAFWEGHTSVVAGTTFPNLNMRRSSATTNASVVKEGATVAGGTKLTDFTGTDGKFPRGTPINGEVGIILEANTDYSFLVGHVQERNAIYSISWFLREV